MKPNGLGCPNLDKKAIRARNPPPPFLTKSITMLTTNRIAVIGAGSVGSACAYALLLRRIAGEVILIDVDERLRRAQAADLSDSAFLSDCRIREGTYADAAQCDVVVITAGAKQHEGETRMDLVERNLTILREVIDGMHPISEGAVLLLVANPVDVLTRFAQEISGLPGHRVIGTGTFLDTARLRSALAEKAQVSRVASQCLGTYRLNYSIHPRWLIQLFMCMSWANTVIASS